MDKISKEQRSSNMSAIRSHGNKTTELALIKLFREARIIGWRRNYKSVLGKPDFVFPENKVAVFVDGCFWHGCRKCNLNPKSNKKYWIPKIERNKLRDKKINRMLRKEGWSVVRIWEHDLRKTRQLFLDN